MLDRYDIEPDCDEATLQCLCLMALINCPVKNIWLQRFFMAILFVACELARLLEDYKSSAN